MKFFLLLSILLFSFPLANAISTQQFNNIHMTPYYFPSLPAQTNQTMWVYINPPDNIAKVLSALFHFKAFTSGSTTTYTLYVNNKKCGDFLVSTTYANSGQNEIAFDCTDLITATGNYTVILKSSRDAGSFFGWLDLTYMNNPPSSIASIGGTEYQAGEPSRVVLQILDNYGIPINNGDCFTTVRNSNDTIVVNNESLNYINGSNGIYFYEFITELPTGVYSTDNYCSLNGSNIYSGDTFHVAEWTEKIKNIENITSSAFIGFVGGTEYTTNDTVNIRVQYLKAGTDGGTPVNNECCNFNLFRPNRTQVFNNQNMSYINGSRGLYYYDWSSIKETGVYTIDVSCYKCTSPNSWNAYSGSTFHVSEWAGSIINMSQNGTSVNEYRLSFAGGTEYTANETGIFVIQFMRTVAGNPQPINDADYCNGTFYYPNMTVWLNTSFTYLSNSNGLYYNATNIPSYLGVYTIDAYCKKGGVYTYDSDTFHVVSHISVSNYTINITNQTVDTTNITDLISLTNSSIFGKLYKIQDEITSVNNTVKNESSHTNTIIQELSQNIQSNFTYTNSLIVMLNNTMNWWGNAINTTINYWGNNMWTFIDNWFWTIEYKLDNLNSTMNNITMGNVTVNATVDIDYDLIALYVISYLKALQKIQVV